MSASPSVSASRHLILAKDKLDEDQDSEAGGSGPELGERLPLNTELRSYMKTNATPDSNTRTGLNGTAEGVPLNHDTLGPLTPKFINNWIDDDGSVLRHVEGIEYREMGGLKHEDLGLSDLDGPASPLFVSGVSGAPVTGSLFTPTLATGIHPDGEDIQSTTPPGSRTVSIQLGSTDREEPEECALLKSLLESSDPWGLMKKTVLNLPSPTPSEIERKARREEKGGEVRRRWERRGVGYVTPPPMDTPPGTVAPDGEIEMEEIGEGEGGDEDLQGLLDFCSSQSRTGHFSFFRRTRRVGVDSLIQSTFCSLADTHCDTPVHRGPSTSGFPYSDFATTSTTMDTFRRDESREIGQSTRKRSRRSSDSEGSEDVTFTCNGLVQVRERELFVALSPSMVSKPGSGSGVLVSNRKQSPSFFPPQILQLPFLPPAFHNSISEFSASLVAALLFHAECVVVPGDLPSLSTPADRPIYCLAFYMYGGLAYRIPPHPVMQCCCRHRLKPPGSTA